MLGINGWEFLILIVLAVVILGPERLPEYAAKLAQGVRKLRVMAEGAKVTLKDQLGPEYQDINWRQYDPRQYDPRRIVREAPSRSTMCRSRSRSWPTRPGRCVTMWSVSRTRPVRCSRITGRRQLPPRWPALR